MLTGASPAHGSSFYHKPWLLLLPGAFSFSSAVTVVAMEEEEEEVLKRGAYAGALLYIYLGHFVEESLQYVGGRVR